MTLQRQSNIELCRLASILLVMLVHTTSQSLGDNMSFGALLLEGFSVIGVNVFILITGYFSASPKKSSLANLAFICFFWMIVKMVCRIECGEPVTYKSLFFITTSNWFIASYIGLLFLSPILNTFCNYVNKKTLWGVVIALLIIEVWFDLIPPSPTVGLGIQKGYSVFSFMVLYLLARAIKLYGLPNWFNKNSLLLYFFCSFLLCGLSIAVRYVFKIDLAGLIFAYTNPIVILSSVAFLTTFERMQINSMIINHLAKSTLAVLLGHSAIFFLYTKQFYYLYEHFSGIQVVAYWVLAVVIVFCASIAIDQIRLLLYKPIEKWIKVKIKNNNIFDLPDGKIHSEIK